MRNDFGLLILIGMLLVLGGLGVKGLVSGVPMCGKDREMLQGDICIFHNVRRGRTLYLYPTTLCHPGSAAADDYECRQAVPDGNNVVTYDQRHNSDLMFAWVGVAAGLGGVALLRYRRAPLAA